MFSIPSLLDLPPLFFVVGTLTVTWWYIQGKSRLSQNLPPNPAVAFPIVGHLPYIMKEGPVKMLRKWRHDIGGDIFGIWLGQKYAVVVCSHQILKEALVKQGDYFSDRPLTEITLRDYRKDGSFKGILFNIGPSWKEQRSVSLQILKDLGMGKNWLAIKISEEVECYLKSLSELNGEPHNVQILTNAAVSNVICAILLGQRFENTDPLFLELLRSINQSVAFASKSLLLAAMPFLRHLPVDIFKIKRHAEIIDYLRSCIKHRFIKETVDSGCTANFIAAYIEDMKRKKDSGKDTFMDEINLERTVLNLIVAGSETTSSTILWALAFAINYPLVQEKCHQEIMDVIGPARSVIMNDRQELVYVSAFIMETQRLGSIVPLSLFHKCTETVELCGYTIPKGTTVIPDLDEILKDPKTWGDPLVFRPERFIEYGKLVVPDEFIPFSIGRRYCMGESLAKMELFLFITAILQRFDIRPEDPNNIPRIDEPKPGVTSAPKDFKVKFVDRFSL